MELSLHRLKCLVILLISFILKSEICHSWSSTILISNKGFNILNNNLKTKIYSSNADDDYIPWEDNNETPYSSLYDEFNTEEEEEDWEIKLKKKQDGSFWESSFSDGEGSSVSTPKYDVDQVEESLLDTLQSIAADEVQFINTEAERADKMRQMQEYGFSEEAISATLGVETNAGNEIAKEENPLLEAFRDETSKTGFGMFVDDGIDKETVESHTTVERDEETQELVRSQMVYVDEHSCIGCTNCAMIAQSTFFMEGEHGRARVFQQWGDDDETIAVAIETCPVDCIHYVPYDELKKLEIERRDQNINFKARLVSQGEYGGGSSHRVGGPFQFTEAQKISGNMQARCRNCPSAGCKNCPMYGVGENPEFRKREQLRLERRAKKEREAQLKQDNRIADL